MHSVCGRSTTAPFWSCGSKVPRAKRRLGQHFLADPRILARIADALGAGPADTVLEVGPGPGGLTGALARRAGHVVAIEMDPDLVPLLQTRFSNVRVIQGDALEVDCHNLMPPSFLVAGKGPSAASPEAHRLSGATRSGRQSHCRNGNLGIRCAQHRRANGRGG